MQCRINLTLPVKYLVYLSFLVVFLTFTLIMTDISPTGKWLLVLMMVAEIIALCRRYYLKTSSAYLVELQLADNDQLTVATGDRISRPMTVRKILLLNQSILVLGVSFAPYVLIVLPSQCESEQYYKFCVWLKSNV